MVEKPTTNGEGEHLRTRNDEEIQPPTLTHDGHDDYNPLPTNRPDAGSRTDAVFPISGAEIDAAADAAASRAEVERLEREIGAAIGLGDLVVVDGPLEMTTTKSTHP